MRKSKIIVFGIVCLVLCVFVVIPAVRLAYGEGHDIKVSYQQAQLHDETLTLTVRYSSGGEFLRSAEILLSRQIKILPRFCE